MVAQTEGNSAPPNLTQNYNQHSIGTTFGHVAKHVLAMGAMMGVIGLAAAPALGFVPGVDLLSGVSTTPGDLIVQTAYGAGEMLNMIVDTFSGLFSIGGDLITNLLEGNFAPSTWDSLVMSHGSEHVASGMAHGVAGAHAPSITFDEWLRNAFSSGDLPYALEDSEALGITLEEHMMNEYGHEGH